MYNIIVNCTLLYYILNEVNPVFTHVQILLPDGGEGVEHGRYVEGVRGPEVPGHMVHHSEDAVIHLPIRRASYFSGFKNLERKNMGWKKTSKEIVILTLLLYKCPYLIFPFPDFSFPDFSVPDFFLLGFSSVDVGLITHNSRLKQVRQTPLDKQ